MAFHEGWRQREVKEHESERKGSSGGDSDADLTVFGSRPDRSLQREQRRRGRQMVVTTIDPETVEPKS